MFFPDSARRARVLIQRYPHLESVPLWTIALITGIASVLFARSFNGAEELSLHLQQSAWFYAWAPACFCASWFLVDRFAPDARGSGIPQVMAAIQLVENRADGARPTAAALARLLGGRTIAVKIASALICVVGGGAIGREGPTIQIAAGLFFVCFLFVGRFFSSIDPESWLVAGGGAGIAAAFNTPLGGLVYAIEELATRHFTQFRTALISSVMVSGMAALWLAGNYLYFGEVRSEAPSGADFLIALALGVGCGGAGQIFGLALVRLSRLRRRLDTTWKKALVAIACGLAMAFLARALDTGLAGPGRSLVLGYLGGTREPGVIFSVGRFLTPLLSYFAGGAGGIFAPSLAAGASIGSWLGHLAGFRELDFFILMGMVAFLTGVTHAPFTSLVLVMEMTDRHSMIFPLMVCTFGAFVAARVIGRHSFYEIMRDDILTSYGHGSRIP